MKKLFALLLALSLVVCMAACGTGNDTTTEPEVTTTEPEEVTTTTEEVKADANYIEAGMPSNHENGWEAAVWSEDGSGVYFNLWANDLPFNEDWSVRYTPLSGESVKLIRDGEVYNYGGPGYAMLVKFGTTAYYLVFDRWITQEQFPLQEGDVIILEGDFINQENGYTIHFDKTYIQCKVGSITKFSTTAPDGITE